MRRTYYNVRSIVYDTDDELLVVYGKIIVLVNALQLYSALRSCILQLEKGFVFMVNDRVLNESKIRREHIPVHLEYKKFELMEQREVVDIITLPPICIWFIASDC